jgi:DNA-binding transcriptional LysR family regulator
LVVITHPDHPLARHRRIEMRKLARQRFVAFERDVPTRRATDRMLRRAGVPVDVVMEFDNVETIKRAVEINAGIAIVPALTVESESQSGALRAIEFSRGGIARPLGIVIRRGRERTQVMDRFVALLQGKDGPLVSPDEEWEAKES